MMASIKLTGQCYIIDCKADNAPINGVQLKIKSTRSRAVMEMAVHEMALDTIKHHCNHRKLDTEY